ncbi:MAG: acetate/propionate family kinase [Phycisphaeraceae bacterium]
MRSVLCLNAGSSSLKFALYEQVGQELTRRIKGAVENIASDRCRAWYEVDDANDRREVSIATNLVEHEAAVVAVFKMLDDLGTPTPQCIGHRVVHGGLHYTAPTRIDETVLSDLRELIPLAPLHQPSAIAVIETVTQRLPDTPQVACFDTAIHRRMPEVAQRLALPRWLWDEGVRRYGFHGLSYEFLLHQHPMLRRGRTVIAHLGHGASLAAFLDGQSQDTTMGFTPAGGLMMGTRCGDLDPGVFLYLMDHHGYGRDEIDRLVNAESGLLGVSGLSSDMQTLERASATNSDAAQAIEMFCRTVCKHVSAMACMLGGLDQLVFTAGIGENSARVRGLVIRPLGFLGLQLDDKQNQIHAPIITAPASRCTVYVLPTDEELMIARHALAAF